MNINQRLLFEIKYFYTTTTKKLILIILDSMKIKNQNQPKENLNNFQLKFAKKKIINQVVN